MTSAAIDIIEAAADPELFKSWFRDPATWRAWFTFLKAMFGLPMSEDDWALFRQCTGRDDHPTGGFTEAWLVVGRRGGKSIMLALIAVFLACFIDWSTYLNRGERGVVLVVAADKKQARVIFRYVRALLTHTPLLAPLVERETQDTLDLSNGLSIEILAANFRTVRGYSLVAALLDELAFWRSDESANPDTEILAATRPAMASIPGSMLLCASSPYARRGALWNAYRRHFGKPSSALVWKADTRTMNPTISQDIIDEAIEADPANAAAEFGAEFRSDVQSYISREVVEAAVVPGRFELPPVSGVRYFGFVDPSGGSSDSMTLAIAHREKNGVAVLDAIRERRPPFSPEDVTGEFATLLKAYRCSSVTGDRFGGEWPRERMRLQGVAYELAEKPKSDLYRDALPALNSGKIELLDHPRLVSQICSLERRTARGGRDSIDHPPGASSHDDIANAALAALLLVGSGPPPLNISDETMAMMRAMRPWRSEFSYQ
jgi:Phage Terminase